VRLLGGEVEDEVALHLVVLLLLVLDVGGEARREAAVEGVAECSS
jgi:hypothetical protein